MIIHLTDEDSDDTQSQFFHPPDNRLPTRCFIDMRLCVAFYDYSCGALFLQSIVRMIKNGIVHMMLFLIVCVLDCNNNCFNENPQSCHVLKVVIY